MAIKTVSQLDPFDNNQLIDGSSTGGYGQVGIGYNLTFFKNGFLTNRDKSFADASSTENDKPGAVTTDKYYSAGADYIKGSSDPNDKLAVNTNTYWGSLFEISKPTVPSKASNSIPAYGNNEYNSYSIQYEDLLKNILWDVKSYLNFRNNLNDYDLSAIVQGNQYFKGDKWLIGNLSVSNTIKAYGISAYVISSHEMSARNLTANSLTVNTNAILNDLTANSIVVNNLTAVQELSIGATHVKTSTRNTFFDGYAIGLSNSYNDHSGLTQAGTYTSSFISKDPTNNYDNLENDPNRTGMPVCFVDGIPYELTCVMCALSAYNLVDRTSGKPWTVGSSPYIQYGNNWGGKTDWHPEHTVVKFVNGVPVSCNVIDFANHALWSDLGEKYLPDQQYEPGTLVKFGGEKEITIADTEVNAIVSTKAFSLNTLLKGGITIALCGRVPTKVIGKIQKFDKIMLSDTPGIACKWDGKSKVIGRALESNDDENIKLVECVTQFLL